jgi:hypothetical protein
MIKNEYIDIRDTAFWKSTGSGELLMGCRLKAKFTQQPLSARLLPALF